MPENPDHDALLPRPVAPPAWIDKAWRSYETIHMPTFDNLRAMREARRAHLAGLSAGRDRVIPSQQELSAFLYYFLLKQEEPFAHTVDEEKTVCIDGDLDVGTLAEAILTFLDERQPPTE